MLKLTTDKHEASRGLSATAELLVPIILITVFDTSLAMTQFNINRPHGTFYLWAAVTMCLFLCRFCEIQRRACL